ncbi:MAG: hypothetical protein Q7K34_04455 [archaeon]|nr:hypothetical protein [archaeon]
MPVVISKDGLKVSGFYATVAKTALVVILLFLVSFAFSLLAGRKIGHVQVDLQHEMVSTVSLDVKNSLAKLVLREELLLEQALSVPVETLSPQEKTVLESKKFSLFLIKKLNEVFIEDLEWLLSKQEELYEGTFSPNNLNLLPQEKLLDLMNREISLMVTFNFIYLANLETIKNLSDRENLASFLHVEKIAEGKYSFNDMDIYLQQAKGFLDENFFFSPVYYVAKSPQTYEFGKTIDFYKKFGKWSSDDFFIDTINYDALHFENRGPAAASTFYLEFEMEIDSFDYVFLVREGTEINRKIAQYMDEYRGFLTQKFLGELSSDDALSKFARAQKIITLRNVSRRLIVIPETI